MKNRLFAEQQAPRAEGRVGMIEDGEVIHLFSQEHHALPTEAYEQPEVDTG